MKKSHYLAARLSFLVLVGLLIYRDLWTGLIVTGIVILAGLIFSQATLLSMYSAHRRQMVAIDRQRKVGRKKAKTGHQHKK